MKRSSILFVLIAMGLVIAGCGLKAGEVIQDDPPAGDSSIILFKTDFSEANIGELPQSFNTITGVEDGNIVEIVEDADLPSGKALKVATGNDSDKNIGLYSPRFDISKGDPETVVIDYQVQWLEGSGGSGQYIYLRNSTKSEFAVVMIHSSGNFTWHAPLADDAYRLKVLAPLEEGWNVVRVIANRDTGKADVYLNDLNTPLETDLPFQRKFDSWGDITLQVVHERKSGESRHALYGDIVVMALEK